jgi:hypothetical protein
MRVHISITNFIRMNQYKHLKGNQRKAWKRKTSKLHEGKTPLRFGNKVTLHKNILQEELKKMNQNFYNIHPDASEFLKESLGNESTECLPLSFLESLRRVAGDRLVTNRNSGKEERLIDVVTATVSCPNTFFEAVARLQVKKKKKFNLDDLGNEHGDKDKGCKTSK